MSISIKLEAFEGPLDLLLHLIDKNKINIYDIPITEITHQYIEYIKLMEYQDLDSMSEFLVMASELLSIKSKMLLPKEEEEDKEDPRYDLVERLLEYKMFKYISDILKDKEIDASKVLYKEPTFPDEALQYKEEIDPSEVMGDISLIDIQRVFSSLIRKQEKRIDPIRSKFGDIEIEKINISDKMEYIEKYSSKHRLFPFTDLLSENFSKQEVIVTFLGVLELTKTGQVVIKQNMLFDDFIITRKASINKDVETIIEKEVSTGGTSTWK